MLLMVVLALLTLLGANVYFADLHSHTSYSDGQGLPPEAYRYARDSARIDVLALTDHTSYLNRATYLQEREIAAEFTEPGRFVALAGQEFGSLSQFGHFSIYDADSLCPVSASDLTGFYRWLTAVQEPAQFNHPQAGNFNRFVYDRPADVYVTTVEVVNGSGDYTPENEAAYFEALRKGWHCAPVANQDNHRRHWGDAQTALGQIPLTGIVADTLTRQAILDALMLRRVYAVEVKPAADRIYLKRFEIGGVKMGSTGILAESSATLDLEVTASSPFHRLELYRNGELFRVLDSIERDTAVWTCSVPVSNDYYLVKGVQSDSDRFWSAPIWLSRKAPPVVPEFYPNPLRSSTRIVFALDTFALAKASLDVFDAAGRPVFHDEQGAFGSALPAGSHLEFAWTGVDLTGKNLPNGIYLVRVAIEYQGRKEPAVLTGKVAIRR